MASSHYETQDNSATGNKKGPINLERGNVLSKVRKGTIERRDLETRHQGSPRDCVELIFDGTKNARGRLYYVNAYNYSSKDRDSSNYTINRDESTSDFDRKTTFNVMSSTSHTNDAELNFREISYLYIIFIVSRK